MASYDDVQICIAGKNNVAIEATKYLLEENIVTPENLYVCPNAKSDGLGSFQGSFRKYSTENNLCITGLPELYDLENIILVSLEYENIIDIDKFSSSNLFNIHFSALPKYKGMYTSCLPIIYGETNSGVTLHKIDRGIDTGPIIDQLIFSIDRDDTARDLYAKYVTNGIELFRSNIVRLIEGKFVETEQPPEGATYWSRKAIDYNELSIDLCATADQIRNQIRAFNFREYQLPVIMEHEISKGEILPRRSTGKPGRPLADEPGYLEIATIDYDIRLHKA